MKLVRKILVFFACLTLVLGTGLASAKTFKFDMANEYPPNSIHGENDSYFSKVLKEKSGGKIEITHHFLFDRFFNLTGRFGAQRT